MAAKGIKVAIIDPIKYLVRGDYLKTTDAGAFTRELQELLIKNKIAAIFTFPIRKPPSFKGLVHLGDVYSVKGATEWVDEATFVTLLEKRPRIEDNVIVSFAKNRVSSKGDLEGMIVKFNAKKCMFKKIDPNSAHVKINLDES
jgi:hypothetical protein